MVTNLVKSGGQKIPLDGLYDILFPEDEGKRIRFKDIKNHIKDLRKDMVDRLQITKDENPTVTITISDEHIILISNPPISY